MTGKGYMQMPIPTESVQVNGFTMDYFRFGHGSGTLAILPGLSVKSVMREADAVADAYRLLTDDFTIYVFDRKKELPAVYPVRSMAQDTADAFRALGLQSVCLFGASQGGMIAMQIAVDCPALVQKLAVGSSTACMTPERFKTIGHWVRLAKENKPKDLFASFVRELYPPDVYERSRSFFDDAAKTVTNEELERFICLAEGMQSFDVTESLDGIVCPTLVIGSADDRVLGADASAQIVQRLSRQTDLESYMYEGFGHAAYDTAPDYPERLLRFFTKT